MWTTGHRQLIFTVIAEWLGAIVVGVACLPFGLMAGVSGFLGAAAYATPSSILALRLLLTGQSQGANPVSLLLGILLRIAGAVAILGLVVAYVSPIVWPALLVGLIVAVHVPLFALLIR
jgi:F0F1-type ATP synthase assembly protein I